MQISIKTNEQLLTGEIDAYWNLLNLSIVIWKRLSWDEDISYIDVMLPPLAARSPPSKAQM